MNSTTTTNTSSFPFLLGLTGPARAGKSTVGEKLSRQLNHRGVEARQLSFASPIYRIIAHITGHPDSEVHTLKAEDNKFMGISYRHLLQTLGTDWGRNMVHPDLWLVMFRRTLGYNATSPFNRPQVVIIPDVRFANEAEFVRKHGLLVHVKREEGLTELEGQEGEHESERPLRAARHDCPLYNPGTSFEELDKVVSLLADAIIGIVERRGGEEIREREGGEIR